MKALFTDIDGTLITSEQKITPRTREALQRWVDAGNLLILSSSRSAPGIEPIVREYGLDCCISAIGGALLLDQERRVIYENGFSVDTARRVTDFILEKGYDLTFGVYTRDLWIVADRSDPRIVLEESIVKTNAMEGTIADIPEDVMVEKILCMCATPKLALEAEAGILEAFPELSVSKSSPVFVEINNTGISKAIAIQRVCEHFAIALEDTIAFGDNYNDLLMLQTAHLGVAMGNAPEDIRRKADMVTKDNEHDGLAVALEEIMGAMK